MPDADGACGDVHEPSEPERPVEGRLKRAWSASGRIHEAVVIIVVYLAAHGLVLLNGGLFWDDWAMFRLPRAQFAELLWQTGGSTWPPEFYTWIYASRSSVWAARAVSAALLLVAFLAFNAILRRIPALSRQDRLLTVIVAATFPVFSARVPLIDATYIISLSLFMIGWWLADAWVESRRPWLALAACALFFASFRTQSLGFFYLLVLFFLLYRQSDSTRSLHANVLDFVRTSWMYVIPPVAYLVVKVLLPAPSGTYQGYNQLTPGSLASALWTTPTTGLIESFFKPVWLALTSLGILAAVAFALLVLVIAPRQRASVMRVRVGLASFGVGCMAFFLGVLPYVAVGKVPVLTGFESRHQLLVPFGAAVMLVSAVRLALGRFRHGEWMGLAVILVFVAGSISADIGSTLSYYREMYKTDSFLLHVREQPEFKSGTAFMIDDRTPELNVSGRGPMRFYEYSGMFASVFDEETRFGADEAGWRAFEELERASRARGASYLSRQYKLGGYVVRKPQYVVTITRGSLNVSRNDTVIRLAWLQLTNHAAFEQVVERAVDVRVSPYPAP